MSARKEPMSSVDTTWLRMESPTSRMHIGAVLVFDRALLQERLLKFERFRQRVVRHDIRAWWEEDPQFSLHRHVLTLPLEEPSSQACLQAKATALMNSTLDFKHPLWTVHLVPEYQEGSALIVRIHHCIADGMSLIRVLLSLTDDCEDPSQASLWKRPRPERAVITMKEFGTCSPIRHIWWISPVAVRKGWRSWRR
jgi:diacylglycerol O-acyltransferase / wax synthase